MFTSICQKLFNPAIPTFENWQIEVSRHHKQLHRGLTIKGTCSKHPFLAVKPNEQAVGYTNRRFPSSKTSNRQFLVTYTHKYINKIIDTTKSITLLCIRAQGNNSHNYDWGDSYQQHVSKKWLVEFIVLLVETVSRCNVLEYICYIINQQPK